MKEIKNSDVFLRPRFKIGVLKNSNELLVEFKKALRDENYPFHGKIAGNHIFLDVPKEQNKFWSPQLHLELECISEKHTLVKGLFGPKPQIWTFFMFLHFLTAFIFIGFSIMLYVQNTLKNDIRLPLAMVLLAPIIWFTLYFLGRYGKRRAKHQMIDLQKFMRIIIKR